MARKSAEPAASMARFSELTREWFTGTFAAPTAAQTEAWEAIANGDNTLVIAPTGSGKTLAAFLWAIDRLAADGPRPAGAGTRVLYVSPLKALAVDVERNLSTPLTGITRVAERLGQPAPTLSGGGPSPDQQPPAPLRRPAAPPTSATNQQATRHPDHHARVAVPHVDLGGPRVA